LQQCMSLRRHLPRLMLKRIPRVTTADNDLPTSRVPEAELVNLVQQDLQVPLA